MKPSTNRLWSGKLPSTVITFITVLSELICMLQHCWSCSSAFAKAGRLSAAGENSSAGGDATVHQTAQAKPQAVGRTNGWPWTSSFSSVKKSAAARERRSNTCTHFSVAPAKRSQFPTSCRVIAFTYWSMRETLSKSTQPRQRRPWRRKSC